jgi:predicted ATPase
MKPWYVITGAPSSGKTTLIDSLSARGYRTIPEAARAVIDEHLGRGRRVAELRADEEAFQWEVLRRKQSVEAGLPASGIIFFDRGIPDTIAYYRAVGLSERAGLTEAMRRSAYSKVFVLDRLPLEADYARVEDPAIAARIDSELERAYRELSMQVVRVPVMPLEERVRLVLRSL